ncbi:hypothetical protein M3197_06415 [Sporosarcina aquimarina]|uniref:hypothetical protein n=1 Tax=Sporosarcina aquimarina TaxID=114975 RepID=UPI00203EF3D0|nr:hypothetical protein [Sporosarcina aquimarina]MCM3757122.1 hypothetical protein [Sporosarcina aquimarina]
MKKIAAAFLALTLILSPIGTIVFNDHSPSAEAKGYKSGKKGFSPNQNNFNKPAVDKKDNTSFTKNTGSQAAKPKSGGLMKGLMLGGLAGLLFGGLFANMGILGSILGLLVNVFAIIAIIGVIRMAYLYFKKKKQDKDDMHRWQN